MATIADLDVTTAELERRIREGQRADQRHQLDPADVAFAALPVQHPENVTDSDWTPGGTA